MSSATYSKLPGSSGLRSGFAKLPLLILGGIIIIGAAILLTSNTGQNVITGPLPNSTLNQLYEAESFTLKSPLAIGSEASAFSGKYVSANSGVKTTKPTAEATLSISVPATGTYYMWIRTFASTKTNDASYVGIDSSWDRVWPTATLAYEWVKVETANNSGLFGFNLTQGIHTLKLGHGELGAHLDAIYLSTNPNPTLPAPNAEGLYEAELFTLTAPMTQGSDVNAFSGKYVSANSGTATKTPIREASFAVNVPATNTYYLWVRTLGPTSGNDASYVGIDSSWDRIFPVATGTYEWVKVATTEGAATYGFSLTAGSHTMQVGHGELNARIDALYLSTDPNTSLPTLSGTQPPPPPPPPAPTVSLSALPTLIISGQSSTLTWSSTDATSCTASNGWTGTKATSGSQSVSPTTNTTYTLTCTGDGGSASKSVTVSVSAPADTTAPTVSISSPITGDSYTSAQTVIISASASDNVGVTKVEFYDGTTLKGSDTSSPFSHSWSFTSVDNGTHSWTAKAYDAAVNVAVSAPVSLTVNIVSTSVPTVSLSASPTSITSGQSSTLTWSSTDATACSASGGWTGTKAVSGSQSVSPTATTTYTLLCTGSGGSASKSVTVSVASASLPPPPPPPAGAYEGFGAVTQGGAGKPTYFVTNLNDSGAGSLRDAVSQGNRYIKFLVGGTITLSADLNVNGSFITVDGFSAPAPGITITNKAFMLRGTSVHDIIVTGIRARESSTDNFAVRSGAYNIIFDHVSSRHAADGGIDIVDLTGDKNEPLTNGQGSHNVTVQWSIIEDNPAHNLVSITSYGGNRVTYHHNLFINADSRNPQLAWKRTWDPPFTIGDVRNNLIWNFGSFGSTVLHGAWGNVVNNYYYSPSQTLPQRYVQVKTDAPYATSRAYVKGNVAQGVNVNIDSMSTETVPFAYVPVNQTDACTAAKAVKAQAGPRFGGLLDSVDASYVNQVNITCN